MIPFALKQAWFWLALIGLVQCWGLLVVFPGRAYAGLWGRLYYCTFLTLLEGIFCLGMVWQMDPRRMPHAFCIVQVVLISLGSFALTGVCAAFAVANALAVFRPQSFDSGRAVLAWHLRYIPFVIVFPMLASTAHTALLVTLDAVHPSLSDDLHCDATRPVWMRLVGYAGVPLVVSIPFLCLSFYTAIRLYKMSRARFSETFSTIDADGFEPSSPTQSYELHENRRKSQALRLTAFFPYPSVFSRSAAGFQPSPASASASAVPESPANRSQPDFPLHQHPFPPSNPLTDASASPVPDVAPDLARPQFDGRTISSTPDSAFSSSMPVFAPNVLHRGKSPAVTEQSRRASLQLQSVEEGGDVQIGLAITTDDAPDGAQPREDLDGNKPEDDEQMMGVAVTTDEPDGRPITPAWKRRSPSLQTTEVNHSPPPSEVPTLHEMQRAQDASVRSEPLSKERARSSESTARTLLGSPHALPAPDTSDHPISSPHAIAPHAAGHQHNSSLISAGTFLVPMSDQEEDREPLTSLRGPATPKTDHGIDVLLDLLPREAAAVAAAPLQHDGSFGSHAGHHAEAEQKGHKWEWDDMDMDDGGDGDAPGGVPAIQTRGPEKRLGIYNPTPATPTASMLQRRMQRLQQKREQAEQGTKKLLSATWRLVLFQIAFFSVQLLASLSTILDVAHGTITPFGTQHVALLLAAWGPLFIFFRIPKTLRFWKGW